jgi:hypothetical protein
MPIDREIIEVIRHVRRALDRQPIDTIFDNIGSNAVPVMNDYATM